MSETIDHECGVAALAWLAQPAAPEGPASELVEQDNVAPLIPSMLLNLQNRGQLAAGLSTYNPQRAQILDTYKAVGSVHEVFRMAHPEKQQAILNKYAGRAAIGHTRYSTSGKDDTRYAQPFERHHGRRWKWFSFAFNGTLSNFTDLRDRLLAKEEYHFSLNTDTEIIMHALAFRLRGDRSPTLPAVMRSLAADFDGAYNMVFLDALGRLFVARDPLGIRPMCYAVQGRLFAAASESVALANLGFSEIRALAPGHMALVDDGRLRIEPYAESSRRARCFFEWVYFANVASVLDETGVYQSRAAAGARLAEREDQPAGDDAVVVPVPDTAKAAADAFAFRMHIPCMEGIIRNRYVGRTFIQPQTVRGRSALDKYTPLPSVLSGKRVFLVEDSIVRATTLKALADVLRERGNAREVHARVACPPIVAPCFYGIDMSTLGELFAPRFVPSDYDGTPSDAAQAEMARALHLDSLRYLSVPDVADCLSCERDTLCLGCVIGTYPTPWGNKLYERARENQTVGAGGRTYE